MKLNKFKLLVVELIRPITYLQKIIKNKIYPTHAENLISKIYKQISSNFCI